MSDAPKVEEPVVAAPVVDAPVAAEPVVADAAPEAAAETPAAEAAPAAEEPAVVAEVKPVEEGVLGYKGPGLLKYVLAPSFLTIFVSLVPAMLCIFVPALCGM